MMSMIASNSICSEDEIDSAEDGKVQNAGKAQESRQTALDEHFQTTNDGDPKLVTFQEHDLSSISEKDQEKQSFSDLDSNNADSNHVEHAATQDFTKATNNTKDERVAMIKKDSQLPSEVAKMVARIIVNVPDPGSKRDRITKADIIENILAETIVPTVLHELASEMNLPFTTQEIT